MFINSTVESSDFQSLNGTDAPIDILAPSSPLALECSNSPMFHLVFLCQLIAYLTPQSEYSLLLLHFLLSITHFLWMIFLWSCSGVSVMFGWFTVFFLLNVFQTGYQAYLKRFHMLDAALENAFKTLFKPINVSRYEFKKMCRFGKIRELAVGESYAIEGITSTNKLALLLEGKVCAYCNNQLLHSIGPNQFLDSPEWESSPSVLPLTATPTTLKKDYELLTERSDLREVAPVADDGTTYKPVENIITLPTVIKSTAADFSGGENRFNVTLTATATCTYVCWDRRDLELYLLNNKDMANLFKLIVARDITDKLYAMNEKMTNDKGSQFDIRLPVIVSSLTKQTTSRSPAPPISRQRSYLQHQLAGANHQVEETKF